MYYCALPDKSLTLKGAQEKIKGSCAALSLEKSSNRLSSGKQRIQGVQQGQL